MVRTSLVLKNVRIKNKEHRKEFDKQIQVEMRNAARAWLRATLEKVPVYTGMARGSLMPLGQLLRVAIPIHRSPTANDHGHANRGSWTGFPLGHFSFDYKKTLFRFNYSTDVKHYEFNELNVAPSPPFYLREPTPWYSFVDGKNAFKAYMDANLAARLPKIEKYTEEYIVYKK